MRLQKILLQPPLPQVLHPERHILEKAGTDWLGT
jgi:hypothetical protein